MYSNSLLSTTCRSAGGRSDEHAAHRRQNAVLLIDQDASRTRLLCDILSMSGLRVSTVATTTEAQRALSLENIGAIVAEHKTVGGHAWLDWMATQQCSSRVIYLHEGSELSTAVDLMKRGAHEVFESPGHRRCPPVESARNWRQARASPRRNARRARDIVCASCAVR